MMVKYNEYSLQQSNKQMDMLKNTFEFDIVFKNGIRFNKDFMAIYAMPLHDFLFYLRKKRQYNRKIESNLLLGFSISKKVAKACKRNLLRRRIKSIMRRMVKLSANYVFVFVCRKGVIDYDFNMLSKHISYSIKRLTQQRAKVHDNKQEFARQNPFYKK